jgi:hypothetical protein
MESKISSASSIPVASVIWVEASFVRAVAADRTASTSSGGHTSSSGTALGNGAAGLTSAPLSARRSTSSDEVPGVTFTTMPVSASSTAVTTVRR